MAAAAVAGATISVVLKNLLSFPVGEFRLLWNFNNDLEKLRDSVATIVGFLEDADTKQGASKPVQRWLMKLEGVAFDADYVFNRLHYQRLRKGTKKDSKLKKKVRCFFPNSRPIAFRYKMARKIRNINKELRSINQEARELGLRSAQACREASTYLETDSYSEDRVFVGRDNDVAKIVKMVTNAPAGQKAVFVLPIVGMGGLGKTTLTRKVYNDYKSAFGECIWVHVGEIFEPVNVLKKILESLTEENADGRSKEVVLSQLQNRIGNKRYLLVLDDVWNVDLSKWLSFITPLESISLTNGNVIIVTTRQGNVASIVKTIDILELEVLSKKDCWFIIQANAFGGERAPSEYETIGTNIAEKCEGLPLAAKVLGSLLRGKSEHEWCSIEEKWLSNFGRDGKIVSEILRLSFDNLSSSSLKKCFAFCSIIAKGCWMGKDELIHLWMAEGLLQVDDAKDMESVGNEVFEDLLQSSLLQVQNKDFYGNIISCGIHDFVRDLASSILNSKYHDHAYKVRYILKPTIDVSSPIPKEHANCVRALNFIGKISHIMFSNMKCLHVLILNDDETKELPIEIGKVIGLRYLDISHTRIECLPNSIGDLCLLQTLRATKECGGGSYLRKLPNTFKFLISLRHLYIPNIKLPPKIGKLTSLQTLPYFQVGDEEGCGIMELGSLNNLKGSIEIHNLEKVRNNIEAKSADLFQKLNILMLKLVWNDENSDGTNAMNVLEGLQPHPNLKSLSIQGFTGESFPSWTLRMEVRDPEDHWIRLDNLLAIRLSNCEKCKEIPMLGHLPRLKSLYLHNLSNVGSIGGSSFYGIERDEIYKKKISVFPALEKLELIDMKNLTEWKEVDIPSSSTTQPPKDLVFCRLEHLKIVNCRQLKSAPSRFPCLKEMVINNVKSDSPLSNICGSKLTSLRKLVIIKVDGLPCLPNGLFKNNPDLLELHIGYCNNLMHLVPHLEGGGASLKKLEIVHCSNFAELPKDLLNFHALEILTVSGCLNLKSTEFSSQGHTSVLRHLELSNCTGLTEIPRKMLEWCAPSLQRLWLTGSKNLKNLPEVMSIMKKSCHLNELGIRKVPKFSDVVEDIRSLRSLQWLGIGGSSDCLDYGSFLESLGRIFPDLHSLRELNLSGMEHWDALPEPLQHLTTLQFLCLKDFGIEELPDWLQSFSSLKCLELWHLHKLRRLPSKKAMQALSNLSNLHIQRCPLLEQNLIQAANHGSERYKISHIFLVTVNGKPLSDHAH